MNKVPSAVPILPQLPLEIIRSRYPIDARVFFECVIQDNAAVDTAYELPTTRDLAAAIGVVPSTVQRSLQRLSTTPYLKIIPRPGKRDRYLVRIRYYVLPTTAQLVVSEGIQRTGRKQTKVGKVTHPKPFHPDADLVTYHRRCKNSDVTGIKLADLDLAELWELTGHPDPTSLHIALREIEAFKPRNGGIGNIVVCLQHRFVRDDNGRCVGRLKPDRSNRTVWRPRPPATPQPPQEKLPPIHPTELFNPATIDEICFQLNAGKELLRGYAPVYFADLPVLEIRDDSYHLTPGVEKLRRLKPGFWEGVWRPVREIVRLEKAAGRRDV